MTETDELVKRLMVDRHSDDLEQDNIIFILERHEAADLITVLIKRVETARDDALEEAAEAVGPKRPRPCGCEFCDCHNTGDAEAVAAWDAETWATKMIRALKSNLPGAKHD